MRYIKLLSLNHDLREIIELVNKLTGTNVFEYEGGTVSERLVHIIMWEDIGFSIGSIFGKDQPFLAERHHKFVTERCLQLLNWMVKKNIPFVLEEGCELDTLKVVDCELYDRVIKIKECLLQVK